MIEYYRYLKEYDESYESVFKNPKPLEPEGQAEPELQIQFILDWEKKYAKDHTKDWKLDEYEGGSITRTKFGELFSTYCASVEVEDDLKFGAFFSVYTIYIYVYI